MDADQFKDKFMESLKLCGIISEEEIEEQKYDEHREYVYTGKEKVPEGVVTVRFDSIVREVGYSAFSQCTKLKKVIMNEGLWSISREAFMNCMSLEEVVIPSTVFFIGENAFSNCTQMKEVVLSEGRLSQLPAWSFGGCSSLERIILSSLSKRLMGTHSAAV